MAVAKMIHVEVAYATPDLQKILVVDVPEGSSIERAIERSGIMEIFPDIDLLKQKVGIFSKWKKLGDVVKDGDRIEIYRSLVIDPMAARRLRSAALPRKKKARR